jgi:hypothetical protein
MEDAEQVLTPNQQAFKLVAILTDEQRVLLTMADTRRLDSIAVIAQEICKNSVRGLGSDVIHAPTLVDTEREYRRTAQSTQSAVDETKSDTESEPESEPPSDSDEHQQHTDSDDNNNNSPEIVPQKNRRQTVIVDSSDSSGDDDGARVKKNKLEIQLHQLQAKCKLLEAQLKLRQGPEEEQAYREMFLNSEPVRKKLEETHSRRQRKVLHNASRALPAFGTAFSAVCGAAGRGTSFASELRETLTEMVESDVVKESLVELYHTEKLELFADPRLTLGVTLAEAFATVAARSRQKQRADTNNTTTTTALAELTALVPTQVWQVPDEDLYEAFPEHVARAELARRHQTHS